MKIEKAVYKKDNYITEIFAASITKKDYYTKYQGYLYCFIKGCNAKLSFVERKNEVKFFRTFPKCQHKDGCPNEVFYDESASEGYSTSGIKRYNISDKHIIERLKKAYEKEVQNSTLRTQGNRHLYPNRRNSPEPDIGDGLASLFSEGVDIESGREPYILTRKYNEISSDDIGEIRCIIGYVSSMQIMDTHGYLNLTRKQHDSVKLHFSEYFISRNKTQYEKFNVVENYIAGQKSKHARIICCCIGKLSRVSSGINILIDRWQGFTLNGMNFYEIIDYLNSASP